MNVRTVNFDFRMDGRQVEEGLLSLIHTIMFLRTEGKSLYHGSTHTRSVIGYTDVNCDFIDLTYARLNSDSLDRLIKREISGFSELLRSTEGTTKSPVGQFSLEFYQKRPTKWNFQAPCIPWEVWTTKIIVIKVDNEDDRQTFRERIGELLSEKILFINEEVNKDHYVPKVASRDELAYIYDLTFEDIQPYNFRFSHSIPGPSAGINVGSAVKNFIKNSLVN